MAVLPSPRAPFVGRQRELELLTERLESAAHGHGSVHILAGEGGIGKSRLAEAVLERATARGLQVVVGRAYPVESGIPFAVFADGFVPLLRTLPPATLQTLTRGAMAELGVLFPSLRVDSPPARAGDASDLRPRLFDTFANLLARLAERQPMVLLLENLHLADPSSLDLFHFLGRTTSAHPLLLLASYNDVHRASNRNLRLAEQSLLSLGAAERHVLPPLSLAEVTALVAGLFEETPQVVAEFCERVYTRTRGNAFFVEETLKELVRSERLRHDGTRWSGWATPQLALPDSIRDVMSLRYERLSEGAQRVVQLAAVVATDVPHTLLQRLTGMDDAALLEAVDQLLHERVFEELPHPSGPAYAFTHPMMQEMLYAEFSQARRRALHAQIADALEDAYGSQALAHAQEIAVHFARAAAPEQAARATQYLAAAGRLSLERGAAHEALEVLTAALTLLDPTSDAERRGELLELLGRTRHRLGDYARARQHLQEAVALAEARDEPERVAGLERRLGAAALRLGDFAAALQHQERGRTAAARAKAEPAEAELLLARASVLLEVGQGEEARQHAEQALVIAERLGDPRLLGRVHLALQTLAVWRGPSADAVTHGAQALEQARQAGDVRTAWQAEWVRSYHAGLTGNSDATLRHANEARRLAEELRSPVLRLWTAEVEIEYRSGIGDWSAALALADHTIEEARAFGQRLLLPRVLVWSALIHCGRGDLEEAKERIDEAWRLSGADRLDDAQAVNVHSVLPAHVGMGYYHLYRNDYRSAMIVGEQGLAIADRTGYEVWAVHRLLPLIIEASLWLREWEDAERYGQRLREASARLGHPLAGAWADASVALLGFLRDGNTEAIDQLRQAADALDAIPFVEHGARLRRKLADALLRAGDEDGSAAELRRVHEVFRRLGASLALGDVREKLREMGRPLPPLRPSSGAVLASLTPTETEVAKLVMRGMRNKEIGLELGQQPRTVSTHLQNIYKKFEVSGRGALAARLRELGL